MSVVHPLTNLVSQLTLKYNYHNYFVYLCVVCNLAVKIYFYINFLFPIIIIYQPLSMSIGRTAQIDHNHPLKISLLL
jgi:hypothetical protein